MPEPRSADERLAKATRDANPEFIVASSKTHALLVTVDNDGVSDIRCNVARSQAVEWLRAMADDLERSRDG